MLLCETREDNNDFPAVCFANVQGVRSPHFLWMHCLTATVLKYQQCKSANPSCPQKVHTTTLKHPYTDICQCSHTDSHTYTPYLALIFAFFLDTYLVNLRFRFGNHWSASFLLLPTSTQSNGLWVPGSLHSISFISSILCSQIDV